ncbi:MAG: membrane protein insertase YidC, partial [Muribaculaceae bacterium]|nr:membrane protein insertase YidC [Muribaculaceae bacterium]
DINVNDVLANHFGSLTPEQQNDAVANVRRAIAQVQKYKSFARYLSGANDSITLENDLMKVTFATRGGLVSQVELKKYMTEVTEEPSPIKLFTDATDGYGFTLTTSDQRFDTREFNFRPIVENDSTVMMALDLGGNAKWGIRYTLHGSKYLVKMEIVQNNMGAILPASTSTIDLNWHQKMARNEKGRTFEERNSAILYKFIGEGPDDLSSNGNDSEQLTGRIKWVAFKNQFFSSVLIADEYLSTADLTSTDIKSDRYLKDMSMHATLPYTITDGTASGFYFYFGPNDYPLLSSIDDEIGSDEGLSLTRLVPLGWGLFRWINQYLIIPVFTLLGKFIHNYGIIILLLTIFIKLILFPFTFKSFKSQARMRVLAPEIKEINDKYPGQENAMKRQQETMALYSRAGASPFSGCLPMLLQMPVLIAMFSFFPSAIELRGQSFLWVHDLSAPDYIFALPFTIPFYGDHVSLFCLLMTVVNIVYTRINMQNQPGGSSMPGMKWMMYLMPVMFLFFFNDYAAGLSYYYFLSLLITIVQTWIFRKVIDEKKVRAEMLANAKKPRKKSGFMARLEEAQRQQQAMLRQQQQQQKGGKNRR